MNIKECIQKKLDTGLSPQYTTRRGKLLWVDTEHYDDYCQAKNCKILRGANGKLWGYTDDPRIIKL